MLPDWVCLLSLRPWDAFRLPPHQCQPLVPLYLRGNHTDHLTLTTVWAKVSRRRRKLGSVAKLLHSLQLYLRNFFSTFFQLFNSLLFVDLTLSVVFRLLFICCLFIETLYFMRLPEGGRRCAQESKKLIESRCQQNWRRSTGWGLEIFMGLAIKLPLNEFPLALWPFRQPQIVFHNHKLVGKGKSGDKRASASCLKFELFIWKGKIPLNCKLC